MIHGSLWLLISRSCGGAKSEGTGRGAAYKKELRFDPLATSIPLNRPDYRALDLNSETGYRNNSSYNHISNDDDDDDQRNIQPQIYLRLYQLRKHQHRLGRWCRRPAKS